MTPKDSTDGATLFTIGHSNHTCDRLVALLQSHQIELLVDVRSRPYSQFSPHFSHNALKATMPAQGIGYLFLGRELGGQPDDDEFYDEDGRALYWRMAQTPQFFAGIERLRQEMAAHRAAILCSEEDPSMCHRRRLITRVLFDAGVSVTHIRGDGTVEPEEEVRKREEESQDHQLPLFAEETPSEEDMWKSIPSGLRKSPRNSSFEF